MKSLTKTQKEKFVANLWKFTAVFLTAFFGQLALGVTWKQAIPFALAILYGALKDYFSKIK